MHVRTRPRYAHTRSRIYTYALRTRRTKRRAATGPRTWYTRLWWTERSRRISSRLTTASDQRTDSDHWWCSIVDKNHRNVTCNDDEETFAEDNVIPHVTLRIYLAISQNDRPTEWSVGGLQWWRSVTVVRALFQRYFVDLLDEHLCPRTTNLRFFLPICDYRCSYGAPFVTQCDTCVYLGDNVVAS